MGLVLILLLRTKANNVKPVSGFEIGDVGMFQGLVAVRRPSRSGSPIQCTSVRRRYCMIKYCRAKSLPIFPSDVFTTGHGYIMKFAVLACLVLVQLGFEFSRVALKVEQKLITDSHSR